MIERVRGALDDDRLLFLFFRGSCSFPFDCGSQFQWRSKGCLLYLILDICSRSKRAD